MKTARTFCLWTLKLRCSKYSENKNLLSGYILNIHLSPKAETSLMPHSPESGLPVYIGKELNLLWLSWLDIWKRL